jgi:uncharacterized protein YkwD
MKLTKNSLVAGCFVAVFNLSACGGGFAANLTTSAIPISNATECPLGEYKAAVVSAVNAIRSRPQLCGGVAYPAVGALGWHGILETAASAHSTDMAMNNFFAHPGSDGSRIGVRANIAGYSYKKMGENIAAGQSSVTKVSGDWLVSASHCSNMMTASFVDVAVSCKYNPGSTYQYYWTLVMGNR